MKFVNTYLCTPSNLAAITLLSFLAIASFPSLALATPKEKRIWSFQYKRAANAPNNCPTEEYLRTALAANTNGEDPFDRDAPRSISVTIEQLANDVEARITIYDENGAVTENKALHAPSWRCDQLAERIVFALQNIVDPLKLPDGEMAATQYAPQTPTDDPPTNEQVLTNIPRTPPPNPPNHERVPVATKNPPMRVQRPSNIPKFGVSFGGGAGWWNAPEAALSTTIGIELFWKRATFAIEGHYDYAWTVPKLPNSTAERTTVMIIGCARHHWSTRFMIRACGFGDFGKTSFDHQKNQSQTPYAPVADVGARIALGVWFTARFGIEVRADAAFAVARPDVRMQDDRLWRAAPFTGALRLAFLGVFDVF